MKIKSRHLTPPRRPKIVQRECRRFSLQFQKRHIKDKDLSISEIAWLVGYQEVSAVTHAFERWTGKTPSEMRAGVMSDTPVEVQFYLSRVSQLSVPHPNRIEVANLSDVSCKATQHCRTHVAADLWNLRVLQQLDELGQAGSIGAGRHSLEHEPVCKILSVCLQTVERGAQELPGVILARLRDHLLGHVGRQRLSKNLQGPPNVCGSLAGPR